MLDTRRHRDRVRRDSRPASSSRFPRRPTTSRDRSGPGPLSGVDAERRSWACHRAQTVFRRTAADDSANSRAGHGVTEPRSRHRAIAKPSDSGERDANETGGTTKRGRVGRHVIHRRGLDLQRERLPQRPALPRRRKAAREPQSGREQSTGRRIRRVGPADAGHRACDVATLVEQGVAIGAPDPLAQERRNRLRGRGEIRAHVLDVQHSLTLSAGA